METKLNVTKGEWRVEDPKFIGKWAGFNTYQGKVRGIYSANDDLEAIALVPKDYILHNKDQDYEANATLIADAGTTYNKCGYTPSQLLEQNRELLEALRGLPELLIEASDLIELIDPPRNGSSVHSPKLLSTAKFIKDLLTKHSKDE